MPLRTLVVLLDEALRALKRGWHGVPVTGITGSIGIPAPDQVAVSAVNPLVRMAKDHYFAAPDYAVIRYKT